MSWILVCKILLMRLRIYLIKFLLELNERIFFYPKLAAYYKSEIKKNDPVIIDVGSNRGQSISFFRKYFSQARVYGFEPNNKLFEYLKRKFSNNSHVTLLNKGVSNTKGILVFNENILDETSTLEELNFNSAYLKKKAKIVGVKPEELIKLRYTIDVLTLSSFISDVGIGEIDVIKIDTEGHEYKCLQGLFDNCSVIVDYIQLEYHEDDMYLNKADFKDIESILHQNGFFLHKKIKHGFGNFDELMFKRSDYNKTL